MVRAVFAASLGTLMIVACRSAPIATRRWLGCYELSVGSWNRDSRQRERPRGLPDTIALNSRPALFHSDTIGYQVEPPIFAAERSQIPAAWTVSNDTVRVTWTDGFSGVNLWFVARDSGFAGQAESFTDVARGERGSDGIFRPIPWSTAAVRLRPIRCGAHAAA